PFFVHQEASRSEFQRSRHRAHHPRLSGRHRLKIRGRGDLGAEITRIRAKTAPGRKARGKAAKFDDEVTQADLDAERARTQQAAEQLIAEFNARYAVVNEAGKVWIFEWRLDPVLKREVLDRFSHADFRRLYENRRIDVVTDKKILSKGVA